MSLPFHFYVTIGKMNAVNVNASVNAKEIRKHLGNIWKKDFLVSCASLIRQYLKKTEQNLIW